MKRFGLFGFPLSHSFSKKYFTDKFLREGIPDCTYENFERRNAEELSQVVSEHKDLAGLNVTVPHKQSVVTMMHQLDEVAKEIQAVNCIKILRNSGKTELHGFNTDAYGFEQSIKPLLQTHHQRALILGTGGSAKAVAYVFNKLHIQYSFVSRKPSVELTYSSLDEKTIQSFTIIVNCTPLGMEPDINSFPPIPYQYLSGRHLLLDLIYNPAETQFLKKGKAQGAVVKNGYEMLELQAEKSWQIWNR
jgi:shikimate dehydrogenase